MSTATNIQIVERFFEAMNRGDLDAGFALMHADGTWFSLSAREHRPIAKIRGMIEWINSSVVTAPIQITIITTTAEDDRVAVVAEGHAVTVDAKRYDQLYHFLFEFRDRLIARLWEFNDTGHSQAVLSIRPGGALGLDAPPETG